MFFRGVLGRRTALAMGKPSKPNLDKLITSGKGTRRDPTQPILPPINTLKLMVNIGPLAMRAAQGFPPFRKYLKYSIWADWDLPS
ncbi:MAG: hypothetical protein AAGI69_09755 [Cyanobacteria bacterium P01_H01_bin.21]